MEAMITINIAGMIYIMVTSYQIYTHRHIIASGSVHHMISHNLMLISALLAINLYVFHDMVSPIVFTVLYVIQHTYKENIRMINNSNLVNDKDDNYDSWIV